MKESAPVLCRLRPNRSLFLFAFVVIVAACFHAAGSAPFEFRDGDRVALVGDTFIERDGTYGHIEQRLTVQFPGRNVSFRNLGWSADTPRGESRASFDFNKPGVSFERLLQHVGTVQPTVVIIGYGMASSFAGADGVPQFKTDMNRLMDAIASLDRSRPVRFVLVSPIRHEKPGSPLPDPDAHNRQLALYTQALRELAADRNCAFVSLFDLLVRGRNEPPLTDNGIHLSSRGYARAAEVVAEALGWPAIDWRVNVDAENRARTESRGTRLTELEISSNLVRFVATDDVLVPPVAVDALEPRVRELRIAGLNRGRYELRVDGVPLLIATERQWRRGVKLQRGPQFDQAEELRRAILKKNELFFNRWRPQNETYLFGFRKHEQGQNAREISMFDPLVQEQEARIAVLRQPTPHRFEIVRVTDDSRLASAQHKPQSADLRPGTQDARPRPQFDIAPGFEINLFAESPLLAKPIQMNFDPQGRLWIAGSSVYPQILPSQSADDKIIVLEDTDGDGYAEKSTVFAEGLLIPTGIAPGDGGVYVGQSTELLHFADTNGDGVADTKRIVLSGFGTEDTHHLVHTLRWGHDGQLYFNQSIYIHTHIETPHGIRRLNSGGVWQLRPSTMELGVFVRGFCNPWGHEFDAFGQSFITDGAGYQGLSWGVPGATYFTYSDMRRELQSVSPGSYPKFCGLEIVRSTHFPDDWQGNALTCDFRAHRIVRFAIEEQGSAYVTRELPDLLRTTNVTFRPIDVRIGPDGALYIADWSNPIIQHGEVDFRDPRRDHELGRIWRVTTKGRPLVKPPSFTAASNRELLDQLVSSNANDQQQARRVLTERGATIRDDLARWTRNNRNEQAQLQALWMYQAIDIVEPALLGRLLNATDGRIRAAAVRVVGGWHPRLKDPIDLLAECVTDEHPRVRVEAVRALAQIPSARSAELVLGVLDRPMDAFLDYAAWMSINELAQPWLAAVKSGAWNPDGNERQLEFALKAIPPALASEVLGQVLRGRELARDGSGPWPELIAKAGGADEVGGLLADVVRMRFDETGMVRALAAINEAAKSRDIKPANPEGSLRMLMMLSNPAVREQAVRLAGNWRLRVFGPELLKIAAGGDVDSVRLAAFESLRNISGPEVLSGLENLATDGRDATARQQAVLALGTLNFDKAKQPAMDVLVEMDDETRALEFWRSLLQIKGAAPALASALPRTGLPPLIAKAGLRAAREGGRNEPDLVWALARSADLDLETQSLSQEEMMQLAASALSDGDPERGERIYRRTELACVTCHAIGGVGGKVGPDLTSIGASAPMDYLIESMFYPNRKIKEGYHSVTVETTDGLEYSGVLVSENTEQIVIRDATDREVTIPRSNVEHRAIGNSLMPSGLLDALSASERLDLFRFLSELGKPGRYDASRGNVARRWRLLPLTVEAAQFGDEPILQTSLSDARWQPANTLVDGRLPREEFTAVLDRLKTRTPHAIYAAAQLQVPKGGRVRFKLSGAEGAAVWLNGKPVLCNSDCASDLPAGTHTFIIRLNASSLPEAIRLETNDATFLVN